MTRDDARRHLLTRFPLVEDHPDVAGVLRDPGLLAALGPALAEPFQGAVVDRIVAPEARGPILGALVAVQLRAGLVLARKDDRNHPGADRQVESAPTWRGTPERFQARSFDLRPGDRTVVVDDWITTGNSIRAVRTLIELAGAHYVGATVLVDKASPSTLDELSAHALVRFDELT